MVSICPVFKWLGCLVFKKDLTTRSFCILPLFGHSNTKHVRHSEFHCTLRLICLVESALLQMLFVFTTLYCCGFLVNCFHAQFVWVFISFILKLFFSFTQSHHLFVQCILSDNCLGSSSNSKAEGSSFVYTQIVMIFPS